MVDVFVDSRQYAYPNQTLLIIGSGQKIVSIGIYADEINYVYKGQEVSIEAGGSEYVGTVLNISELPNPDTNTYSVNIAYDEANAFTSGELCVVKVSLDAIKGLWIPFNVILNDGQDYVYVINNSTALKKYLDIQAVSENMALVDGIDIGDEIVSKGMNKVKAGAVVSPVNKGQ